MGEAPRGDGAAILVVEDSATQAEQLRLLLQQDGYQVDVAVNGRAALESMEKQTPRLVLSDVVMPEMDGYELCRVIKGDARHGVIPVILLTALTDATEVLSGLACGADNFVTKPYDAHYLLDLVARTIAAGPRPPVGGAGENVLFRGRHYLIAADRRHAIDLLLTTYETAVRKNRELLEAEERLEELNRTLERRVAERTEDLRFEIARREQAEELLRARLAEIEEIYRSAPVGLFLLDGDCRLVRTNDQIAAFSGLPVERQLGRHLNEVLPELAERLAAHAASPPRRRQPLLGVELHVVPPGAASSPRDLLCNLIPFEATRAPGILGAVLDITDRKRAEEASRRLAAIVESTDEAIFSKTLEGIITSWNAGAEHLYGYAPYEVVGRSVELLVPPDRLAELYAMMESLRQGGRVEHLETRRRRKDGTVIDVSLNLSPIRDAAGVTHGISAIAHDITRRKAAEAAVQRVNQELRHTLDELRTSQEQVVQAEKMAAVGTMVAGVVHELNNPLMGIMSYVEFVRDHPDDPYREEVLVRAQEELKRMGELLRSMLSFSRPGEGRWRETSVPELIDRVSRLMAADFRGRGIELLVHTDASLPPAMSRPEMLQQVFMNLLLNARDAVKESPKKQVDIRAWCEQGDIRVEFADTGHGVPAPIKDRIFEPFFTTKPPGEGTGMGLSVSRNLVTELGGDLTFESEEGKGSRFRVRLPAAGDCCGG